MKCKYCNAEVQPNARFCTSCGGDLSKFDKCVNCGEFIDKGESTCPHCGTEQPQLVQPQKSGSKTWLWIVVAILLLGILGSGGYLFLSNKDGRHAFVQETDSIAEIDDSVEPSTSAAAVDIRDNGIDEIGIEEPIESSTESIISIEQLRNVSPDEALPQQGFNHTTYSVREGYETDIWYKNCEIDKDGEIHSAKENACVVELFDGMSASLRITVLDKNIFESVKKQGLEYSVKTENGYCFKWNKDEMSHMTMGESDYYKGGHFIDISLILN